MSGQHFHAGHNMPGYLPESDVYCTDTFDNAKQVTIDDLEYYADSLDSWVEGDCDDDSPCGVHGDDCGHDKANDVSAVQQDLNLDNGPEWGSYAGDLYYWIVAVSDDECDEFGTDDES